MSIEVFSQEVPWLKRFFSGQNQLTWQNIESGQAATNHLAQVIPWLRFLNGSKIDCPIVLPLFGKEGPKVWYGMAPDEQVFSQLVEEIGSFIGPSFSDYRGDWSDLSSDSEHELALKERFGTRVIKFSAQRSNDKSEIERSLLLYQSLLARRPSMSERVQRPFGKIRGDFDRALLAGNASRAQAFLDELKTSGRVDASQQRCLEVRFLAGLGRQEELARNQPLISSVADLALPAQTLVDVIEALYETYIRPIEAEDSQRVFSAFKLHIIRSFGDSLFKDRKGIRHPTVLRAFLLFELIQPEPNAKKCNLILSTYAENAEGRDLATLWCKGIQENKAPVIEPLPRLEIARQAIADEDYSTALDLCFELLPEYWAYSTLLRCAVELNSLEVTLKVLEAVRTVSNEVKDRFTPKDHVRLESLLSVTDVSSQDNLDSGWIGWAREIANGMSRTSAMSLLNESITKWSVDEYAHDVDRCALLAQIIGNANKDQEAIYRDTFPFLVEFFVERPDQPCRTFTPIYATIIKILGWSGALSADELEIVSSLTLALLTSGPSQSVYIECVDDLHEIIKANNSPIHLDWALNISELLALYPAQDGGDLRLRFFTEVISIVSAAPHRITVTQRDVLETLAKDYCCLNLLESLPACDNEIGSQKLAVDSEFKGLIGIYTLTEGAGQRAKCILQRRFPESRVETNNDYVATDRLISLANNADVFVFAWKSSKHQAYYCVKESRQEREIIMPSGKGAASIVKSALDNILFG
jgi:hypothetical protein